MTSVIETAIAMVPAAKDSEINEVTQQYILILLFKPPLPSPHAYMLSMPMNPARDWARQLKIYNPGCND